MKIGVISDIHTGELLRLVIVTIPGGNFYNEISGMIGALSSLTGSRTASSYLPHMTLRTGVFVPCDESDSFIREFGELISEEKAIKVKTERLRVFPYWEEENQKFIILYSVRKSQPLSSINRRLLSYEKYKKSDKSIFQPHISLLYGDVDREGFEKAKQFVRERPEIFEREFTFDLDNVALLSQGRGGNWSVYYKYKLRREL